MHIIVPINFSNNCYTNVVLMKIIMLKILEIDQFKKNYEKGLMI